MLCLATTGKTELSYLLKHHSEQLGFKYTSYLQLALLLSVQGVTISCFFIMPNIKIPNFYF